MAGRKLKANVWVAGDLYKAGSTPSKEIAELITNPKAWGGLDRVEPATPEEPPAKPPTKAELLAEVEKRNEGREDDAKIVPASEKNADLEAALKADDEKSA